MWLNDPYVVEDILRRRVEQQARAPRVAPHGRPRPFRPRGRLGLAVRVLIDARFAGRVADALAVTATRPPEPTRGARA